MNAAQTTGDTSIRIVAGRLFALEEGVWKDTSATTDGRMIRIEPYGRAHFDLLQALPEIRSRWTAFQRIHLAAGELVLALEPGGSDEPTESEIRRIAEAFLQDEPTHP